jgi:molybdenum cofactor synthesis domain-containing protein
MGLIFHDLIKFQDAAEIIGNNIGTTEGFGEINLSEAVGRISSEDVFSKNNLPLYSRSQVDGYAILASDVRGALYDFPVSLDLAGETEIGEKAVKFPGSGKCIKVPTGGVIPFGADAMVPFEDTKNEGNKIVIFRSVNRFNDLSNSGIDVIRGEKLLNAGSLVDPRNVAVLASTGIARIKAVRKLKIGIVSTGNELLYPGSPYREGKIYESNSLSIKAELSKYPAFLLNDYGIVEDDYSKIREAIDRSIEENDVTITIGSTSAGDHDMVYKILGKKTPGIIFHGIRVKPGKPTIFAKSGEKVLFGLPGFPVSSMMILYSLVIPNLFLKAGHTFSEVSADAVTAERFDLHEGNTDLLLVKLVRREGGYRAYQVPGNSGSISRISKATGYSIIDSKSSFIERGTKINIKLFTENIPSILIYGQYLPAMEKLPSTVGIISTFVEAGYNEIKRSMENGDADVYLWNYPGIPDTDKYDSSIQINVPFGIVYSLENYHTMAVLYRGSGLFEQAKHMELTKDITYLDNPEIICDYVKNGRCDAGVTFKQYADQYALKFKQEGSLTFHICINRNSLKFSELKEAFKSITGIK